MKILLALINFIKSTIIKNHLLQIDSAGDGHCITIGSQEGEMSSSMVFLDGCYSTIMFWILKRLIVSDLTVNVLGKSIGSQILG